MRLDAAEQPRGPSDALPLAAERPASAAWRGSLGAAAWPARLAAAALLAPPDAARRPVELDPLPVAEPPASSGGAGSAAERLVAVVLSVLLDAEALARLDAHRQRLAAPADEAAGAERLEPVAAALPEPEQPLEQPPPVQPPLVQQLADAVA